MKTLVTGGAGFIGSHLVDLLIAEGHEVVVLDNLSHGRLANLADAETTGKLTFIEGDLLDVDFDQIVAEHSPEVIFHLAAQIDVRESVTDPIHDAETNILATIRLAEAARKNGVRKVVHTSSGGAIYGTSSNGRTAAFRRPSNVGPVDGLFLVGGSTHPGGGLPLRRRRNSIPLAVHRSQRVTRPTPGTRRACWHYGRRSGCRRSDSPPLPATPMSGRPAPLGTQPGTPCPATATRRTHAARTRGS